jgi:hypothetical protein
MSMQVYVCMLVCVSVCFAIWTLFTNVYVSMYVYVHIYNYIIYKTMNVPLLKPGRSHITMNENSSDSTALYSTAVN